MRTEQERMELIRKRTLEIRKKEKKRRQRIIDMGCAAACVLLIICLGMLMPQITAQTEGKRLWGSCQHFWHKQCTGVYRDGNNLLFHRSLRNSPFISVT